MRAHSFYGLIVLVLVSLLALTYFHSKSIDRAHLLKSVNALLVAHDQLTQHGSVTNPSANTSVYRYTNQVTVHGTEYLTQLAADVPGMTNAGRLVATSDGILIWIDSRGGAVIVRGADRQIVLPRRFRDF